MNRPPGRTRIKIRVVRLPHGHGLDLPATLSAGSAGMDLFAALVRSVTLCPGQRLLVPTGLQIALPAGFEGQVRPRSGLALKKGLTILNAPGTIDSDYRGEVGVILINLGARPVRIKRGDRIAQLVVAAVASVTWEETGRLSASRRGTGGFGHTGR